MARKCWQGNIFLFAFLWFSWVKGIALPCFPSNKAHSPMFQRWWKFLGVSKLFCKALQFLMFGWSEGVCLLLSSWALDHQCRLVSVTTLSVPPVLDARGSSQGQRFPPHGVGQGDRERSGPGVVLIVFCCLGVPFEETLLCQNDVFFLSSLKVQVIFQCCFYYRWTLD